MISWRHNIGKIVLILLALALMILLCIALIGCHVTGRSFDECFFGACCGSLYVLGIALGFTYKEICVIVNIYLEAGLCVLSALWVTWTCIYCFRSSKTWGRSLLLLAGFAYGLIYLIGFLWLCNHYAMPMNDAFDLCYRELIQLTKEYHTTYNNVNYVIFILFPLLGTLGNIAVATLIKKLTHSKSEYGSVKSSHSIG